MSRPVSRSRRNRSLLGVVAIVVLRLHLREEDRLLISITRDLVRLLALDSLQSVFSLSNCIVLLSRGALALILDRLLIGIDCLFGLFRKHELRRIHRFDHWHELALVCTHQQAAHEGGGLRGSIATIATINDLADVFHPLHVALRFKGGPPARGYNGLKLLW